MKIYIACALTHVPRHIFQSYADEIHTLAQALYNHGHHVKYAFKDSDPQLAQYKEDQRARLCYKWDRNMVEECDLVIAEASFPSIGLGIELQIAESLSIPIILSFNENLNRSKPISYKNPDQISHDLQIGQGYISLMALGLPNIIEVIKYETMGDILDRLPEL
ncbi:hypothetical protein [Deinococcus humi]|uniref:Nucleoside 2-deoxyribosyltransferase n=1 Tax=Deinococcus humi TaxID=662880 RepID=A0A7W8JZP2_9DEIO|nr:hypothetical protein [Deinococcus humi]MBB5366171.1 nucleoside 2-deoxyribosyltransferase [Deinococcus humi]GGO40713.1 hypothetical protein GCM10008949_50510 [Deinococcus humi]